MSLRALSLTVAAVGVVSAAALEPALRTETMAGWTSYINATESRISRELSSPSGFLAQDFVRTAAADRRAVLGGAIVVSEVDTTDASGNDIDVPSASVHHWRGAVLIPRLTVTELVDRLQNGGPPTRQEDVLKSTVLERGPDRMKVYLRVQKSKFVTVVYNTEHVITFKRYGTTRASSASTATKIAELRDVNTPMERELPPGEDRGFMWRWNSYWRYEQVESGVIAECESVNLSRGIPRLLTYLVRPIIRRTARESMDRTLSSLRTRFQR